MRPVFCALSMISHSSVNTVMLIGKTKNYSYDLGALWCTYFLIYSIIEIDVFLTLVFSAEKKNSEKNERIIRDDNDC